MNLEDRIWVAASDIVHGILRPNQVIIPDDIDFAAKRIAAILRDERQELIKVMQSTLNRLDRKEVAWAMADDLRTALKRFRVEEVK